jgi:SAM-dependent methyltransferase
MRTNGSDCPEDSDESAATTMWDVLDDPRAPRSPWSISQWLGVELAAYLERTRPQRVLEVGSGFSTAILAAYAARHGAQVVALEHDPRYRKFTAKGLQRLGLQGRVDLRMSPLKSQCFRGQGPYWWYGEPLEGDFDFVFADGPPKILGRRGVFFALAAHLRPGWQMWLDDGIRRHERQCIRLWAESFPDRFTWSRLDMDGKGIYVLEDAKTKQRPATEPAASQFLGICILGAGSMRWWRSVERAIGTQLLRSSHVVVTARDEEPGRTVPRFAGQFVNQWVPPDGRSSRVRLASTLRALAGNQLVHYVLYLNDHWSPSTLDGDWLSRALGILEEKPTVDRVSLQHRGDAGVQTPPDHGAGPVPETPSLLRADGRKLMLQARRVRSRRRLPLTEQLSPGVFRRTMGRGSSGAGPPAARPRARFRLVGRVAAAAVLRSIRLVLLVRLLGSSARPGAGRTGR